MQELTKNYKEFEERNETKEITKGNIEKNMIGYSSLDYFNVKVDLASIQ